MLSALPPIHNGAITFSIAALTAGIAVKPNASPQPTIPPSVVTLTSNESALLAFFFPQADAADLPPPANGMLTTMASIIAIFISPPAVPWSGGTGTLQCPRLQRGRRTGFVERNDIGDGSVKRRRYPHSASELDYSAG